MNSKIDHKTFTIVLMTLVCYHMFMQIAKSGKVSDSDCLRASTMMDGVQDIPTLPQTRGATAQKDANQKLRQGKTGKSQQEGGMFKAPQCSSTQRKALLANLHIKTGSKDKRALVQDSRCPSEPWMEEFFAKETKETYLAVNVGCNKGLDAVGMARILSRNPKFNVYTMYKTITGTDGNWRPACGKPTNVKIAPDTPVAQGVVHCIEPMPNTIKSLQGAMEATGHKDSIIIKHAAMSNQTGKVLFPNALAGTENFSLKSCLDDPTNPACMEVPMYTLDSYLEEAESSNKDKPLIDMLLVDAEGFDWEVLQGADNTIDRARYLTFEVHNTGNWPTHSLVDLVQNNLKNFNCYWTARNKLLRISDCLDDQMARLYDKQRSWSNVVCSHQREVELSQVMENVFERSIAKQMPK